MQPVASEVNGVQSMVDYSDRSEFRLTGRSREHWSGVVDDWFSVSVGEVISRRRFPVDLTFETGTEFGRRLYQYEQGISIYQQQFKQGVLSSERYLGSVWDLGFTWQISPFDAGPISRQHFRVCSLGQMCIGGPR